MEEAVSMATVAMLMATGKGPESIPGRFTNQPLPLVKDELIYKVPFLLV